MGKSRAKGTVTRAARTRASTLGSPDRKPASTHPRAIALAVATAFLPWYLPQSAYGQTTPAPNQMPNFAVTKGDAYVPPAVGTYQQVDQFSQRAVYEGSMTMGSNAHLHVQHD